MPGVPRRLQIRGVLAMLTASLLVRSGQLQVSVRVIGEVTAVQGRDVTLTCNVETKEDVSQLTWQKKMDPNNENLLTYRAGREPTYLTPFAQDRIRILGKGTFDVGDILIRDVRLSDEGTYVCGFSTHPSGIQEREIKLQVHVPPTVSIYLPPIPVQVLPRNVAECTAAAAKPPAYITWVCSSLPYNVNTTDIVHQNKTVTRTSRLWMIPTRSLSGQNATCLVFQQEEVQQEVNFTLDNILYAPQDVSITTHRSKEGILQLRCTASANPPANYTWRRENVSHPGKVTLQPSDVLMVPDTDPDVLDQYVCETNNSVGGERGIIYIYTIAPGCRCHYLVVIGVLVPLLVLCAGLLWCWTRGIIRKGKCLGQMDLGKDLGVVKERTFRFRPPETAVEDPYEFKEENKYVDVPLEAEGTRGQMQDRMNREAEERSLEASGKSIALVTSFEKEQSHLDPSKDLKEAEDA